MKQPALSKARSRRRQYLILPEPMPLDQKSHALLKVRDQEIEDQYNVVIVANKGTIMLFPGYEAAHDESD